jgi:hypothetical protein
VPAHRTRRGQIDGLVEFYLPLVILGNHHHIFHVDEVFLLQFTQLRPQLKRLVFVIKTNHYQITAHILPSTLKVLITNGFSYFLTIDRFVYRRHTLHDNRHST